MFGDGDRDQRYSRIILGGLSQGCAMGMFTFLAGDASGRRRLGGFLGMSGWLPLNRQLEAFFQSSPSFYDDAGAATADSDLFAHGSDDEGGYESPQLQAINHIRGIADLSSLSPTPSTSGSPPTDYLQSPVFLGHGSADDKVSVKLGENMAGFLTERLHVHVTWKVLKSLGVGIKLRMRLMILFAFCRRGPVCPSQSRPRATTLGRENPGT